LGDGIQGESEEGYEKEGKKPSKVSGKPRNTKIRLFFLVMLLSDACGTSSFHRTTDSDWDGNQDGACLVYKGAGLIEVAQFQILGIRVVFCCEKIL
jgi:hypothetical protein